MNVHVKVIQLEQRVEDMAASIAALKVQMNALMAKLQAQQQPQQARKVG